jgi:hypothetical protein
MQKKKIYSFSFSRKVLREKHIKKHVMYKKKNIHWNKKTKYQVFCFFFYYIRKGNIKYS